MQTRRERLGHEMTLLPPLEQLIPEDYHLRRLDRVLHVDATTIRADPDARFGRFPDNKIKPGYKQHPIADGRARVVLGVSVTAADCSEHDEAIPIIDGVLPRLEKPPVIEGVFGEAKQWHGLRRAWRRGLSKMRAQCRLIASVINLKRLMAFILLLWSRYVAIFRPRRRHRDYLRRFPDLKYPKYLYVP